MAAWLTDHERFKNITASIQNLVLTGAVLIGGIWTASTFAVLGEAQRASLEREKLATELADQQRRVANGLGISIEAHQESTQASTVSAVVKITNRSTTHRFIDLKSAPLSVSRIDFDEKTGVSRPERVLQQDNPSSDSRVLRSGETVQYLYFFKVPQKGLYLLTLDIKLTPEELEIHRKSGGAPGEEIYWDGTTYVGVK